MVECVRHPLRLWCPEGGNVTLGSICAPNTTRDTEPGFGYRPTVSALFESLRPILGAR